MSDKVLSDDVRALRLAKRLKRRIQKKASKLGAKNSPDTKRARTAMLAISRRLEDAIDILETKRSVFAAVVEQLQRAA